EQNSFSRLKRMPRLPSLVSPFIESIPLNAGNFKDIYIASQHAPLVVLIQDVHMNQEAQKNIALILRSLNDQSARVTPTLPLLVGVEGAFGLFDFHRFRVFEDKKLLKEVADYFLQENQFAAPSYVGMTADTLATRFVGVDDAAHYRVNVKAVRSSQLLKVETKRNLEREIQLLQQEKEAL